MVLRSRRGSKGRNRNIYRKYCPDILEPHPGSSVMFLASSHMIPLLIDFFPNLAFSRIKITVIRTLLLILALLDCTAGVYIFIFVSTSKHMWDVFFRSRLLVHFLARPTPSDPTRSSAFMACLTSTWSPWYRRILSHHTHSPSLFTFIASSHFYTSH